MIAVGGMLERGCTGVGACRESSSHNESCQGLRQPPIDEDTHNNQPEIDGPGGGDTGEEIWPRVIAWEMWCHHFGGDSDQSNNKTKINLLLIEINFFLGRIIKLNKTLVNYTWPTPSKEAPGGGVGWFVTSMPLSWWMAPPWLRGLLDGWRGSQPSKSTIPMWKRLW